MERAQHRYSSELTPRLVEEIEGGHPSVREAARAGRTSVAMMKLRVYDELTTRIEGANTAVAATDSRPF